MKGENVLDRYDRLLGNIKERNLCASDSQDMSRMQPSAFHRQLYDIIGHSSNRGKYVLSVTSSHFFIDIISFFSNLYRCDCTTTKYRAPFEMCALTRSLFLFLWSFKMKHFLRICFLKG